MLARSPKKWAKPLATTLTVASLCWLAWMLRAAWEAVGTRHGNLHWPVLFCSFLMLVFSLWLAFPAFLRMLEAVVERRVPRAKVARLYFGSQMMKHLPGRFLGVAYQALSAPEVATPMQWAGVNVAYMILSLAGTVGVSVGILTVYGLVSPWFLTSGVIAILAACWGIRVAPAVSFGESSRWRRLLSSLVLTAKNLVNQRGATGVLVWYTASWLTYLAAWALLGVGLDESARVGIELCALYSLSWVVGFIALVTPSGLGVRELVFAMLASKYPPDLVVYVAVVARVWMLAADILIGATHVLWKSYR